MCEFNSVSFWGNYSFKNKCFNHFQLLNWWIIFKFFFWKINASTFLNDDDDDFVFTIIHSVFKLCGFSSFYNFQLICRSHTINSFFLLWMDIYQMCKNKTGKQSLKLNWTIHLSIYPFIHLSIYLLIDLNSKQATNQDF